MLLVIKRDCFIFHAQCRSWRLDEISDCSYQSYFIFHEIFIFNTSSLTKTSRKNVFYLLMFIIIHLLCTKLNLRHLWGRFSKNNNHMNYCEDSSEINLLRAFLKVWWFLEKCFFKFGIHLNKYNVLCYDNSGYKKPSKTLIAFNAIVPLT